MLVLGEILISTAAFLVEGTASADFMGSGTAPETQPLQRSTISGPRLEQRFRSNVTPAQEMGSANADKEPAA